MSDLLSVSRRTPLAPGSLIRIVPLFLLVFLVAGCLAGSSSRAPLETAPDGLLLWEIHGHGQDAGILYVLGSIHVGPPGGFTLDPRIERAFELSDGLVVEVDPSRTPPQDVKRLVNSLALLPPGVSLPDLLSEDVWALLQEELSHLGVPASTLSRFEPWWVALTLLQLQMDAAGFQSGSGVDHHFLKRVPAGKPVVALETLDFQLGLFADLSPALQELMLQDVLGGVGTLADETARLVAAWEHSDVATLHRMIFASLEEEPAFAPLFEVTFFERNRSMATSLEELLKGGQTWFVVVGAGHVIGDRGIVALLEESGFQTRQLTRSR